MSTNQEGLYLDGDNADQDKGTRRQRGNRFTRRNQRLTQWTVILRLLWRDYSAYPVHWYYGTAW